jgi:hypothetical protein
MTRRFATGGPAPIAIRASRAADDEGAMRLEAWRPVPTTVGAQDARVSEGTSRRLSFAASGAYLETGRSPRPARLPR